MAGEKGAPRTSIAGLAATARAAVHLHPSRRGERLVVRAHRLPQGHGAGRARARRAGRRARARSTSSSTRSGATACWWSCGTTATRSTATATTRSRGRAARRRRSGRHQQRALRHSRATPTRHRARGGPRRVARSTRSTAGSPPRRFAHLRSAGRAGAAGSHAGPARSSAPSTSRAPARSTCGSPRPSFPDHDVPAGHTEMTWLRELTEARRGSATRRPTRSTSRRCTRSRTSST